MANALRPLPTTASIKQAYKSHEEATSGSVRFQSPSSSSSHRGSRSAIDPRVAASSVNLGAVFGGAVKELSGAETDEALKELSDAETDKVTLSRFITIKHLILEQFSETKIFFLSSVRGKLY